MFRLPERLEVNAIHLPSGDQRGFSEEFSLWVNEYGSLPSACVTNSCVRYSLLSPSITARRTAYTAHFPAVQEEGT